MDCGPSAMAMTMMVQGQGLGGSKRRQSGAELHPCEESLKQQIQAASATGAPLTRLAKGRILLIGWVVYIGADTALNSLQTSA